MNFLEFMEAMKAKGGWGEEGPLTGCRVKLMELDLGDGPIPQEIGQVVDHDHENNMVVVEVDPEYIEGPHDDGLRECSTDQIDSILSDPDGKPLN